MVDLQKMSAKLTHISWQEHWGVLESEEFGRLDCYDNLFILGISELQDTIYKKSKITHCLQAGELSYQGAGEKSRILTGTKCRFYKEQIAKQFASIY